ncbi:hypothetical protein KJ855_02640 [Patescibacteria group bacterium]|nr:hypothetical protein [Patescibacteria group bacterium]
MKIYLAGSVPKGDKEAKSFDDWRVRYRRAVGECLDAEYIDPYERDLPEDDFLCIFGKDCQQVKSSDLILVCAENKPGVGTSQELVIAKMFGKPVITVLPKDSPCRRSNVVFRGKTIEDWIHSFIFAFSDVIIEDIAEIGKVLAGLKDITPKDISIVEEAMEHCRSIEEGRAKN